MVRFSGLSFSYNLAYAIFGGLTPWALIGGYGARDQVGGNVFRTRVDVDDYALDSTGALLGLFDRLELSVARQRFDTRDVGAALGMGRGFAIRQDIVGLNIPTGIPLVYELDTALRPVKNYYLGDPEAAARAAQAVANQARR